MDAARSIDAQEIAKVNLDLADRIDKEGVTFLYDDESDILSITIGKPCEAITEPLVDDIMYRIDPNALKIVGFVIVSFTSDFLAKNKLVRKMLKDFTPDILKGEPYKIENPKDQQKASKVLSELVPV
ncbi:MAG: hypothetical protein COS88_04135 [Chloroflexi bacterium CG07_land_8_20_14_0_80_51_10]|nr:MAG: hypothetical protein COS88_04135 [Chloroflexi bacterium CG07_land_8_20_14_0_80_51_10]